MNHLLLSLSPSNFSSSSSITTTSFIEYTGWIFLLTTGNTHFRRPNFKSTASSLLFNSNSSEPQKTKCMYHSLFQAQFTHESCSSPYRV